MIHITRIDGEVEQDFLPAEAIISIKKDGKWIEIGKAIEPLKIKLYEKPTDGLPKDSDEL